MDSKRKYKYERKYNPNNPKDAEELLGILESLEEEDSLAQQIDKASELELVLHYPQDGNDSDIDDAASDEEDQMNLRFESIGKGILSEKMDVRVITNRNNLEMERSELLISESNVKKSKIETSTSSRMEEEAGPSCSRQLTENNQNIPNISQYKKK